MLLNFFFFFTKKVSPYNYEKTETITRDCQTVRKELSEAGDICKSEETEMTEYAPTAAPMCSLGKDDGH